MAGQDRIHQNKADGREIETPLDDLIRASFYTETRRRISDPDKMWAHLLQRAQTEVTQLPPITNRDVENAGSTGVLPEVRAELQADSYPSTLSLLRIGDVDAARLMTPTLSNQISHYRHAMEMKMWRTVGALGLSMGTL
ncbi:MAG: hypothetical protein ACYDEO_23460 [Aggregatilineales bacterium]